MSGDKDICPMCNSKALYITPHNQLSYCFKCAYTNKANHVQKTLVRGDIKAIRQFYKEISTYYHACLRKQDEDYLLSRGITLNSINTYKIGYCPKDIHRLYLDPIAKAAGIVKKEKPSSNQIFPFFNNCITFPYIIKNSVTDIRARSYTDERRYLSCKGSSYYRGADYSYGYSEEEKDFVLTEGEIKAIVSNQAGVLCNAIPGINNLRRYVRCDIVCFDNQQNASGVIHAIDRLAELYTFKLAVLPLGDAEKVDIDSYVLTYGEEKYRKIISRAITYQEWRKLIR